MDDALIRELVACPIDGAPDAAGSAPAVRLHLAAEVRALIAHRWLATFASEDVDGGSLGSVRLRLHQREALARVRHAIAEHGGALLADDTGLGKTYVALALAADRGGALVVAPAALRSMWMAAMARTGVATGFVSHERLSRAAAPRCSPGPLLIVDEAHHARTPRTRRWRRLAELAAAVPVLLLSATPIHNRRADLVALLSLFLGARAGSLDDSALARCVIRRGAESLVTVGRASTADGDAGSLDRMPPVDPTVLLTPPHDASLLDALLALPPPVPPSDGGDGGALLALSLVRQWSSSVAAARGALRGRLARAASLASALEAGRHPTLAELRAWTAGDDAVQLAFPELMAAATGTAGLFATVRQHERQLAALIAVIPRDHPSDDARAAMLDDLCARHTGERVVAFSAFVDTVEMLARRLHRPGVATLSGTRARVAGGSLSRREALARFAPRAQGAAAPARAERIDLLVTTDLLSEGVNLQDASVVVHLDLPWTAARLAQRVGRVARLGSDASRVAVYAFAPPAPAARLLAIESLLRAKARAASIAVGGPPLDARRLPLLGDAGAWAPDELPLLGAVTLSAPDALEALRRIIDGWRAPASARARSTASAMPIAAVVAAREGTWLALCEDEWGDALLVGAGGGPAATDPRELLRAVGRLTVADSAPQRAWSGADASLRAAAAISSALAALRKLSLERAAIAAGGSDGGASGASRAILRRIAGAVDAAPLHRRAAVADLAARARQSVAHAAGAAAELALAALLAIDEPDEAWLDRVRECAQRHRRPGAREPGDAQPSPRLRAVALLVGAD